MRFYALGLLAALTAALASPAHASTEADPVQLTWRSSPEGLELVVSNQGRRALEVELQLHASGGTLAAARRAGLELAPGARVRRPVAWRDAEVGDRLQARAWVPGRSAFQQARVFWSAQGPVDLASFLAGRQGELGALDVRPSLLASDQVTGRVLFPAHDGTLLPLARARVRVGDVSGLTDDEGRFQLSGVPAGEAQLKVETASTRWKIRHPRQSRPYAHTSQAFAVPEDGGVDVGEVLLPAEEPVTEAAWIHEVCVKGERFLQEQGDDLSWWDELPIAWPDRGDYYSWGTLHISEAHRWDVIGHELGHAVYFGASKFSGGGGSHKIDECYSQGLALSEGWATYFSAAIHLTRDDADAKFEFLVPRRAPIRIENVPEDVCQGHTNEWRVAAFFWDLFDTHVDGGDDLALDWGPAGWDVMRSGFRARSALKAATKLKEALEAPVQAQVDAGLAHNTLD